MKKIILFFFFCQILFSHGHLKAADLSVDSYWSELKNTLTFMRDGSYLQFTTKTNLYGAAVATPALWYSFKEDERISRHQRTKHISNFTQVASDLAPALSFPIIQGIFLTYGIKNDQRHEVEFATQTMATMYLALLESAALSVIDIHQRPDEEKLSKWETQFRGKSSFPSGHVVPYAALAIKTYQFYGPAWAIAPFGLYVATSLQRVRDGKHYMSDVVGSFFLTLFASEGVRKASTYKNNHPLFNAIFDRNVNISYLYYKGSFGPKITLSW